MDASQGGGAVSSAFSGSAFSRAILDSTSEEVARYVRALGVAEDADLAEIATIQAKLAGPGLSARFLGLPGYPTLGAMIARPGHFLGSEAAYRFVRAMQRDDRIVPLVGDLAGAGAMGRLAGWLRDRGLSVAMVYVSDVEFFLIRAGTFGPFVENLARLPRVEGARIVRTSTRPLTSPERAAGEQSTTVIRPLGPFLDEARAGAIRSAEDLFRTPTNEANDARPDR